MSYAIQTVMGNWIDLTAPAPGTITAADISHALSLINRWCGHTCRPYSVAEHSLLVAEIVERELGGDVHAQLAALLHDAHEAFIGDISTPAKRALADADNADAWGAFEALHTRATRRAFAVVDSSKRYGHLIKQADAIALATEWRDLMPSKGQALPGCTAEPVGWVRLMSDERRRMSWADWRQAFADRLDELDFARQPVAA